MGDYEKKPTGLFDKKRSNTIKNKGKKLNNWLINLINNANKKLSNLIR